MQCVGAGRNPRPLGRGGCKFNKLRFDKQTKGWEIQPIFLKFFVL